MNLYIKLENILNYIEQENIPFAYFLLAFFSSVTLRNFLEIFADDAHVPFRLIPYSTPAYTIAGYSIAITFTHYLLFWIVLLLGISIILFLVTKERFINVLKATLTFSPIFLLTPLIDLLITMGKGLEISYIYPRHIFDILPIPNVATPGMITSILTGILLTFLYCKIKTNSFLKGLSAALLSYSLGLILAILPVVPKMTHPLALTRLLSLIFFAEICVVLLVINNKYAKAIFGDMRWLRVSHYWLMFIFGITLASHKIAAALGNDIYSFLLVMLAIFLSWIAALMFNNLQDQEIDSLSNPQRPLVQGIIPNKIYTAIASLAAVLALFFALMVNIPTFFLVLLGITNSLLYSLPPIRFKRVFLLSKIFISVNSLILVMLGYLFAGGELLAFPEQITWYFIVFVTLAMNFIDLKDYAGDKAAGIKTLPVALGLRKSQLIVAVVVAVSYIMLSFLLLDRWLSVGAGVLGLAQFYFIRKEPYQEKPVLLIHALSMVMLLAYLNSPLWLR